MPQGVYALRLKSIIVSSKEPTRLSFNYKQVSMPPKDEEKITFITKMRSFRLKKISTTFQHIIIEILKLLIHLFIQGLLDNVKCSN